MENLLPDIMGILERFEPEGVLDPPALNKIGSPRAGG